MISVRRLLIILCCSFCCMIVSSCATTALRFTDRFPSFVCEQKYAKCEMVVGIESPNNNTIRHSEPILIDPQDAISFLCGCQLEKVRIVVFFGMYGIRLYYENNEYDLLVLSKSKNIIKFNGITYRLKEEDAKKMDVIITNMIGDRRLVPGSSRTQTDQN